MTHVTHVTHIGLPSAHQVILHFSITLKLIGQQYTSAECSYVTVAGSEYNSETPIDGQYQLVYNTFCNYLPIWTNQEATPNFIFYNEDIVSNSTGSSGWTIDSTLCRTGGIVYALNAADGYIYSTPYSVPPNSWLELSPSGSFVSNPNLSIECSSIFGMSDGEVIGIISATVFGAILLFFLLSCIYKKCKGKNLRQISVENRGGIEMTCTPASISNSNRVVHPGSTSASTDEPISTENASTLGNLGNGPPSAFMIEPPAYDNEPPPSYEDVVK